VESVRPRPQRIPLGCWERDRQAVGAKTLQVEFDRFADHRFSFLDRLTDGGFPFHSKHLSHIHHDSQRIQLIYGSTAFVAFHAITAALRSRSEARKNGAPGNAPEGLRLED
jgi:hypothetical protein